MMCENNIHDDHATKINIIGQHPSNFGIRFSCVCGEVIADEEEFDLPTLNGLAINHIMASLNARERSSDTT